MRGRGTVRQDLLNHWLIKDGRVHLQLARMQPSINDCTWPEAGARSQHRYESSLPPSCRLCVERPLKAAYLPAIVAGWAVVTDPNQSSRPLE